MGEEEAASEREGMGSEFDKLLESVGEEGEEVLVLGVLTLQRNRSLPSYGTPLILSPCGYPPCALLCQATLIHLPHVPVAK